MATDTKEEVQLPDAEDLDLGQEQSEKEKNSKIVALWQGRFTRAENFRRPVIAKYLRMYKLYRAYRDAINYAYGTNIMPPIGFEIVETVKPRLASAKIKVNILPRNKDDIGSDSIGRWDDLVEYDLQEMEFDDLKIRWINDMLMYGNGFAQLSWSGGEDGDPFLEICDSYLLYFDPQSGNRLKDSNWEIKQIFKAKALIVKEEEKRDEETKLYPMIKDWEKIEDQTPRSDDPRKERYRINTLKMGQINDNVKRGQATDAGAGEASQDKDVGERMLEIWECHDHVTDELVTIINREHVARSEETPYINVNGGHIFIDLPDITLNNELYAMGHLEPVETIIHEIADSRNQAMDDIIFSLDPIKKVKRGKGYKTSDFKHAPGATWELDKTDDVVIEKPPEVSQAWIQKDNILRKDIESSLALSEYVRGIPQSPNEPSSKVELLLMQTNIRFSLLVRQMEISFTQLVNMIIQMNMEFLGEDKALRIVGDDFRFSEFKAEDKDVEVDAVVDIEPKKEKSPEQESSEAQAMYKIFVVDDKPEQGASQEEIDQWKAKKNLLQRVIAEKFGYDQYADILAPKAVKTTPANDTSVDSQGGGDDVRVEADRPVSIADNPEAPQKVAGPEELLPPDQGIVPEETTPETAPPQGLLARLLAKARGQ